MKSMLSGMLPESEAGLRWVAVGMTVLIAGLLTIFTIYVVGEYGLAMFVLIPLLIGAGPVVLYGLKKPVVRKRAFQLSFLAFGLFTAGLVGFAIEGLVCIAMAAPFGILLTWIGSLIGYSISSKVPDKGPMAMLVLVAIIPATGFVESRQQPELTSVATSIEIAAEPSVVWRHVVEFPELDAPTEFIFKTGIAYPVNARIEGAGVGAVRYCNFTTGSFVEPISVWDEPRLLAFDVAQQPAPMKEISFWDIDAPHLHDYFVSQKGQFKLTRLANGHTLLEGTTWYLHDIKPVFYWRLWSNHIIHKIHERVLAHIKVNAEREAGAAQAAMGQVQVDAPRAIMAPGIPRYLEAAYGKGFTWKDDSGTVYKLHSHTIGDLKINKGNIIACDPFLYNDHRPFVVSFPTGSFPVELAVASIDTDERVAFARIRFSDQAPRSWRMAVQEGQDISKLKKGEIYGYGVDAGTAAFMDLSGAQEFGIFLRENPNNYEILANDLEKNSKATWSWMLWQRNNANVALFSSGWGDGFYATYIGYDAAGKVCRLVTDFEVID